MMHKERDRVVHFGAKAQEILRPWLRSDLGEYLFQPVEADSARKAEMRRARSGNERQELTPSGQF